MLFFSSAYLEPCYGDFEERGGFYDVFACRNLGSWLVYFDEKFGFLEDDVAPFNDMM